MDVSAHTASSGVICEFNPFHSGHAHLLSKMRHAVGEDGCVVCLMSGRAVQRGELAMADPYLRAQMALHGGADLVLELPFPWSAGSAYHFATAGVSVLSRLGVDSLAFGSECGDIRRLSAAAAAVNHPDFGKIYARLCGQNKGSTAAYLEAIRALTEDHISLPDHFPQANDLLGINYLAAIRSQASPLRPFVVHREGSAYRDGILHEGEHPSATALRAVIREAACDPLALTTILDGTMPDNALQILAEAVKREECPVDGGKTYALYHAFFRLTDPSALAVYAEMGGGLSGHICRVAKETATPMEFMEQLRTKQYTDARLRRAMLFALTGVTEENLRTMPTYTTVLAANERGCKFLKKIRKMSLPAAEDITSPEVGGSPSTMPQAVQSPSLYEGDVIQVVTKPADAPDGRQKALAEQIDSLFTLCLPHPKPAGEMMKKSPWVEKDK